MHSTSRIQSSEARTGGECFAGWEAGGRRCNKALLVDAPVYFPEEFWQVAADKVGDVVFAWLVPLLDDEVNCVVTQGWPALESRFEEKDPDLVDYRRGGTARS